MSEQRTARLALRVLITAFAPPDIKPEALELVDVLYAPRQQAEKYAGSVVDTQIQHLLSDKPGDGVPPTPPFQSLIPLPPVPPDWLAVVHSKGPAACNRVAYYVTKRLHPRRKPDLKTIRLVPTQSPPRLGVDEQVCGSCNAVIDPFFSRDMLDLDAVFMTPAQIYLEEQQAKPDDPVLVAQNQASRRWEVNGALPSDVDSLIGLAQQHTTAETVLLEMNNSFAGLPPDSDVPTIDDLPDPREIDYEPEGPDPTDFPNIHTSQ